MKKGKLPKAVGVTPRPVRFQRTKNSPWEKGVGYLEGGRLLAISTKSEILLAPPHKYKAA